jgi:hypothetical protein
MNNDQFRAALAKAKRGEEVAYHSGLLMRDRLFKTEVAGVANAAWDAYANGECLLFQRRADGGTCQYFALKFSHRGLNKETLVA